MMRRIWRELNSNWSSDSLSPAVIIHEAFFYALDNQMGYTAVNRLPARCQGPIQGGIAGTGENLPVRLLADYWKKRQWLLWAFSPGRWAAINASRGYAHKKMPSKRESRAVSAL